MTVEADQQPTEKPSGRFGIPRRRSPAPATDSAPAPETSPQASALTWYRRMLTNPGFIAVAVFVIGTPLGILLTRLPEYRGFGLRSWAAPLCVGLAGGAVILLLALWRRNTDRLAGVTAGFLSVWVVMILTAALRGTPFPFYGLLGDSGRITAMATRYSVTAASADAWIAGIPGEYPPLFPWLIGRASVLLDIPAWQLVGDAEILFTGVALVLGFVLWQRLLPPWTALSITVLGFMFFAIPAKSYEVATLMAFVPWVLGTFGTPQRGRLHWLASGLVAGFIVLTYYGWVIFGIIGMLVIAARTWWTSADRHAFTWYLAKVAAVAFLVSSWFVVPFFYAKQTTGGETLGDLYGTMSILDQMFPFLELTPLGLLQLAGLIGLVWLRGKAWWASPMLAIVVGAYLYRALGTVLFVLTDHTAMAHYTPRLYSTVLGMAGVLTIVHAVPRLVERLSLRAPKNGAAIALTIILAWCGFTFSRDWMPGLGGRYAEYTERAYVEPLPDGRYLVDVTGKFSHPWFPVTPIQEAVEKVYGPNPNRVVLSVDERLFAYLPWPGYIGNDLGGTLTHTLERHAELDRLAAITDPATFATESSRTRFGAIDIFVLNKQDGAWQWTTHMGFGKPEKHIRFNPQSFDPARWVVADMPQNVVVAIRR